MPAPSGAAMPCRLQSHSAGAAHAMLWKNVLSTVPGTGCAASPELCLHTCARESEHLPVTPAGPHLGLTQALPASRKDTQHTSVPCPASQSCFNSVSRTCEGHQPQPRAHFSRLPPSCHRHQGITDRDQTSDTEEHQRRFSSNIIFVGQGRLSWAPSAARAVLGSNWEWRAAPGRAAGCRPAPSHFKGRPAGTKCASPGAQVRARCALQHIASVTRTLEEPEKLFF